MASKSVQETVPPQVGGARPADHRLWIDAGWEETKHPLGVRNRLASIDRTLYICANLTTILVEDTNATGAADDLEDDAAVVSVYRPLSIDQRASIALAVQSLLFDAMETAEHLRNNVKGCWDASA
ncbi:hypothetical protein [Xanthomonas arboricola]|uniref:hypothetical protein n=1 Tax=Xanthomonas arboricola TaxID=56448 RepID=UPI000A911944|nr:hypothetical protein [Xanthomonas arboricola]